MGQTCGAPTQQVVNSGMEQSQVEYLQRVLTADGVQVGSGKAVTVDVDSLPQCFDRVVQGGPEMSGTWVSASDGSVRGQIKDRWICWPDGSTTELRIEGRTASIFFEGQAVRAHVTRGKIIWDDGDVWVKAPS